LSFWTTTASASGSATATTLTATHGKSKGILELEVRGKNFDSTVRPDPIRAARLDRLTGRIMAMNSFDWTPR
jgi:hypothetical protein